MDRWWEEDNEQRWVGDDKDARCHSPPISSKVFISSNTNETGGVSPIVGHEPQPKALHRIPIWPKHLAGGTKSSKSSPEKVSKSTRNIQRINPAKVNKASQNHRKTKSAASSTKTHEPSPRIIKIQSKFAAAVQLMEGVLEEADKTLNPQEMDDFLDHELRKSSDGKKAGYRHWLGLMLLPCDRKVDDLNLSWSGIP